MTKTFPFTLLTCDWSCGYPRCVRPPILPERRLGHSHPVHRDSAKRCLHALPLHVTPQHCHYTQLLEHDPEAQPCSKPASALFGILACSELCRVLLAPDTPAGPSVQDSQHTRSAYHKRNHLNYLSFYFLWDSSREKTLKRILDLGGSLMNH